MKVLGVNASPRKDRNTGKLVKSILDGAASAGASTEFVQLSSINYKGCISCFKCKLIGGESYGRCVVKDALTPVLDAAHEADVLVLGTPIYFAAESSFYRSLVERLWFQYNIYSTAKPSVAPQKKGVALVYTMNIPEDWIGSFGYEYLFSNSKAVMERHFAPCEVLLCTDTKQMDDYSKYEMDYFDPATKDKRHAAVFSGELQKAFNLGIKLVS